MSTTLLTVIRRWQTEKSAISTFNSLPVASGKSKVSVSGYILEEKGPSLTGRYPYQCIPAGSYTLKWHYSARFGRKLPLLYNHLVPMSHNILIHGSNHIGHVEGCLRVGAFKSQDYVGGSGSKFEALLAFLSGYDLDSGKFALEIKDRFLSAIPSLTLLTVTRRWQTSKSTISTFKSLVETGKSRPSVSGYILEPKGPSTTLENQNRRVPAGIYKFKWHHSDKFRRTLPLLYNDEVPEKRWILIHNGNHTGHTEGCLLVGSVRKQDYVENSQAKLREVLAFLRDYNINSGEFLLKIEERFQ